MQLLKRLEKTPYAVLMILFAAVSVTTLESDFLFIDDTVLILNNPQLHFSLSNLISIFIKPLGQIFDASEYHIKFIYYRPALNLLYMLNNAIWGINPVGFHISNLVLHLATTLVVFRCGLVLFAGNRSAALLAASLFCVHPVHNELIGRVAMNENLLGFFMALSFYWYLNNRRQLSIGVFVCAVLTKESAVMLPVLLFFFELTRAPVTNAARFLSPYAVVIVSYLATRAAVVGIPDEMSFGGNFVEQFFVSISALAAYIRLLIVPFSLSIYYPVWKYVSLFQFDLLVSVAICTISACLFWRCRYDNIMAPLFVGTAILLAPVVLKANELILGSDRGFIAERQLYVPAIFFSLLAAAFVFRLKEENAGRIATAVMMLVIPLFAIKSVEACSLWTDDAAVNSAFAKYFPASILAHKHKGSLLYEAGDLDGALREFRAALPTRKEDLSLVSAATPDHSTAKKFKNLASLFERYDLASYQPEYADIHYYMGRIFLAKGDEDAAMRKFKAVLVLQPHSVEARVALARIYLGKKTYRDASREYKLALADIAAIRRP